MLASIWSLLLLLTLLLPEARQDQSLLNSDITATKSTIPETTVIIDPVNAPWIFVPVGFENVTEMVLRDQQPWVLYFHDGLVYEPFRDTATSHRGLVTFGLVHRADTETAKMLQLNRDFKATFLTLPFGSEVDKLSHRLATDVFDTAVQHACASVPDDSIVRLDSPESLAQLLRDGAESSPSKFTAVFTVRDQTPTLLQRVLSKKLSSVFNFGLVARAKSDSPLAAIGLDSVPAAIPGLLVMQPNPDGSRMDVSRLDESDIANEDELIYWEALRFLIEYNRRFRGELPGDNQADDESVVQLTDVLRRERLQFRIIDWAEHLRGQKLAAAPAANAAGTADSDGSRGEEL